MYFHHTITYPDGTKYVGKVDHKIYSDMLGITNLSGKKVLDIATNDGYFAYWAEMLGSKEVDAIDVGSYKNYDWGYDGMPEYAKTLIQPNKWEVFDFHHKNLKSEVRKWEMSVYDIEAFDTDFDLILNFGLLYHLRHPILALDKCRAVCKGTMFLETWVDKIELNNNSSCKFSWNNTDFNQPTMACVIAWLKLACFPKVYVCKQAKLEDRALFAGVVEDQFDLEHNPNFLKVTFA